MNGNQEVFRRIEKKYIVDEPTYEKLIKKLDRHFVKDRYYGKQKRKEMINTLRKLLIDTDQSSKNNSHLQIEESAIAATPDIDMQSIREKFELQSLFNEAI